MRRQHGQQATLVTALIPRHFDSDMSHRLTMWTAAHQRRRRTSASSRCRTAVVTGPRARRRGGNFRQQNFSSRHGSSSSSISSSRLYRSTEQLELTQTASRTRFMDTKRFAPNHMTGLTPLWSHGQLDKASIAWRRDDQMTAESVRDRRKKLIGTETQIKRPTTTVQSYSKASDIGKNSTRVLFAFYFGKRPLTVKFSKFCFKSFHRLTDRCCVKISWNLADGKSVKPCVADVAEK